jgi:PAS domain S-box-containing protein
LNDAASYRVLHVDDDEGVLQLTRDLIEAVDKTIKISSTSNPRDVVESLIHEEYDCVILDYSMPEMNGIELAKIIINRIGVPVILYTGKGSEELAEEAFRVGISDYVRKDTEPAHIHILVNSIRRIIDQRQLASFYDEVLKNSVDGFAIRRNGIIKYTNPAFAELSGHTNERDLVNRNILDFVAEEDHEKFVLAENQRGDAKPIRFEFTLRNRDGGLIPCEVIEKVTKYKGALVTLSETRDTSELKKDQARLRMSETRYKNLFENISNGVLYYIGSPDGGGKREELAILNVNPSAERILDIQGSTVRGKPLDEIFGRNSDFYKTLSRFAQERIDSREADVKVNSGREPKWLRIYLYKIRDGGYAALLEDITSEVKLSVEKERQQHRTVNEITSLLTASRLILRNERFTESAQEIFNSCKILVGAQAGYLVILQSEERPLEVHYLDLNDKSAVDPNLLIDLHGLFSEVCSSGKTITDNEFTKRHESLGLPSGDNPFSSVLLSPLVYCGNAVGVLCLGNKVDGFTDHDKRLAASFTELLAIAYVNHQYIRDLKAKQASLENLNRLIASEKFKYERLIDAAQEGVAVFVKNKCVSANTRVAELMGVQSSADLLGRSILKFITRKDYGLAKARASKALQGGEPQKPMEFDFVRSDGNLIPIESSATRITWEGEPALLYVWRDVSERKVLEADRSIESNRLRALLETAPCLIFEYSTKTREIKILGDFQNFTGYKQSDFSDLRELVSLVHPDDHERIAKDNRQAIAKRGSVRVGEYKIVRRDGKTRFIRVKISHVKDPDDSAHIRGVCTDITDEVSNRSNAEALHDYTIKMAEVSEGKQIIDLTFDAVARVFPQAEVSFAYLKDECLFTAFNRGRWEMKRIPCGERSVVCRAVRTRKTQIVADTRLDDEYVSGGNEGILSELTVPMIVNGKAQGVLNLDHRMEGFFSDDDARLVEKFVEIAAANITRLEIGKKEPIKENLVEAYIAPLLDFGDN